MTYTVKEIYFTLQGEGAQTGRAAVFCRFAGCNLWSGLEADRSSAVCRFCDTDFVGCDGKRGGKFRTAADLAEAMVQCHLGEVGRGGADRFVVLTGGEPMLQVDNALIDALHARDFVVAIETNGTLAVPRSIDWICVSPKAGADLVQTTGDELKLVYPQADLLPDQVEHLKFGTYYLQPLDDANRDANTKSAIAYCQGHPRWRLSLQSHKYLGID